MAEIKHDARIRMFLNGQWVDITDYALQRDTITMTRGRKDERTQTPPCSAKFSLKNNDGRFSLHNPSGPYFGSLGQNNPVEIVKRLISWTPSQPRTDSWGPTDSGPGWTSYQWAPADNAANFDVTLSGATVVVPAAGAIRRAVLSGYSPADVSVTLEYSIAVSNVTGDFLVAPGPLVRSQYYARVEISTAEVVTLGIRALSGVTLVAQTSTGLTHVSGTRYAVRILADGEALAAKIWVASSGEPRDWLITTTSVPKDAGDVGMRTAAGSSNTNVPVTMNVHSVIVESVRFTGELSTITATSQAGGRDKYANVEVDGVLRRYGQGQSALLSSLRRGVLSLDPIAYWPCEEDAGATAISSAIVGVAPMSIIEHGSGPPDFAAFDGFECSQPIPVMNNTGWFGALPDYDASANKMQVRALIHVPSGGTPVNTRIFRINMIGASTAAWNLILEPDGQIDVDAYAPDGTQVLASGSIGFALNGQSLRISLELEQVGGNVHWSLSTLDPFGAAGGFGTDLVGHTIGKAISVEVGAADTIAMGHITFENEIENIFAILPQLQAYSGERAGDRMTRLSAENDVPFVYYGDESQSMKLGAQRVDTFLNLIKGSANAAADADMGTIHERRGLRAIAYRDRRSAYAQTSALTVRLDQVGEPFSPVIDDQTTRNDITLKRTNGGEFRRVLETGRKSVQLPPSGVGRYDDAPELNLHQDDVLEDVSGFVLALGTVDAERYPALKINLDSPDMSTVVQEILDLDVDDRVTITDASGVYVFDEINQLARGYTERLGNHEHTFRFTLSPSQPYDIGSIDDGRYRVGSDTSSLTSAITETATSFSVTTTDSNQLFSTAAGDFPMDVIIGGERITLSAISGATSPQTFTVSARSVNGVRKSHVAGTAVDVFYRWRLGL